MHVGIVMGSDSDLPTMKKACEILKKDGFTVMAYTSDDLIVAKRLEDAGADAIMPLAAPIGSGLGVQNKYNIAFIN